MKSKELNDEIERRYGNPAAFCSRVKRTLWDFKIPQAELARESGYNAGNVNRWLNGRKTPTVKVMATLDEALERLITEV